MPDGIVVSWIDDDGGKSKVFGYSDLIDLKIDVLDLLKDPRNYVIDEKEKKACHECVMADRPATHFFCWALPLP